ncbi:MAG TPA: ABC transporter substrate-binding protein [Rhodospirillales bacterium]|nr:ABC transporter substrate-binding protein [Rhodospirillales bacterium]
MPSRRIVLSLATAAWLVTSVAIAGATAAPDTADEFIRTLADEAIQTLADETLSEAQRESEFRDFLVRAFDVRVIGRFVLGRYWRVATPAERNEFETLFLEFVVRTYARRLGQYGGETLRIVDTLSRGGEDTVVRSEIIASGFPEVRVDWRVRRTGKDYRIVDVTVEGVSLAITQRDEFAAVIRSNGGQVEGLLGALRERTVETE